MKKIENFYNYNLKKFKNTFQINGWGSKKSQLKRFKIFLDIGNLNNKKVLDLGCGTGDFFEYLKKKKINFKYTGVEINKKMIKFLKKKNINVLEQSLFNLKNIKNSSYDFVFLSGALNLPVNYQNNKIKDLIKNMYRISKEGIAINFLSTNATKINQNEFYLNPNQLLRFISQSFKYFILRHDYLEHDFTLFLFKKNR